MVFKTFKDKLPVLGSNILVISKNDNKITHIGILEFTLEIRKIIINYNETNCIGPDYCPQDWYSDDASESGEWDILMSDYWCYPSDLKVPKKKSEKD